MNVSFAAFFMLVPRSLVEIILKYYCLTYEDAVFTSRVSPILVLKCCSICLNIFYSDGDLLRKKDRDSQIYG